VKRAPTLIGEALLRRWRLPRLPPLADKSQRGDVLIFGGSSQVPGALLLAGKAALRAGAGRVQLATARSVAAALAVAFPEARVIGLPEARDGEIAKGAARALGYELEACNTLLVGPGMRHEGAVESLLERTRRARCECTLLLDAAALRVLRDRSRLPAARLRGIVATPHAGEMADLWGCQRADVEENPLDLARASAKALGVVMVLKGKETFIVDPDGMAFRNVAGNQGLATAGSGDTLTGVIAGLAARGAEPVQAAVWGVYLHAKAGEVLKRRLGGLGYLASELAPEIPRLMEQRSGRA
jgi:hydroxyethylthiazole kinase-like uncharacterized protein yjeF